MAWLSRFGLPLAEADTPGGRASPRNAAPAAGATTSSCKSLTDQQVSCRWPWDIPDFRTISDFRKIHLARLEALFVEVLKLCALAGLAKVGTIALDGTKVKANASRHKAMSYDRMKSRRDPAQGGDRQAPGRGRGRRQRPRTSSMAPTVRATNCPTSWLAARAAWRRSRGPGSCWRSGPGSRPPRRRLAARPRGRSPPATRRPRRSPTQGSDQLHRPPVADHEGVEQGVGPVRQRPGGDE